MSLSAFPAHTGQNSSSGYAKVWLAAKEDVQTIPAAASGDVATAITMTTGKVFTVFPFDEEVGAYLSTEGLDAEGTTDDTYTFTAFYRANSAAARAALDALDGVYCIIIGERMDGVKEIIGDTDRGIRLKRTGENAKGGRVGTMFTGTQTYNHLPYTYSDGTIAT